MGSLLVSLRTLGPLRLIFLDKVLFVLEVTLPALFLARLEARPIATLSIEAQERHERRERVYRDD